MLKFLAISSVAAFAFAGVANAQGTTTEQPNRSGTPNSVERQNREDRLNRREDRAEQRDNRRGANDVVIGERGDHSAELNQQLADCFLLKNQEEINLARFALEKTQNPKVKEFAQMLIDDHQKFGQELQKFAGHAATRTDKDMATQRQGETIQQGQVRQPGQTSQIEQNRLIEQNRQLGQQTPTTLPNQPARPGQGVQTNQAGEGERIKVRVGFAGIQNSTAAQWYQIEKEATQLCEQMTKDMLSKEKPEDFDACFVGGQIIAHVGTMSKLQAAERHTTGEFQQVLRDGLKTIEQHKQHAEKLKAELASNQGK